MKIVSILASPNGNKGNTGALLKIVLEGAEKAGATAETILIRSQEVKPCVACDTCHKIGTCPQKDEFAGIKEKVMAADALVLATPNYISHVSAQLKAFLDRCCGIVHCQGFEGKYGAAVVSSGGGDEQEIAHYMNQFLAVTGAVPVGAVWATMGQVQGQDFPENIRGQALALGAKMVAAYRNKEKASEYSHVTEQFKERMRSLMEWRKDEWPFEYQYWKEHRGL